MKKKDSFKKTRIIFIICMLAIPIINWLLFWLYVNIDSIFLAFKNVNEQWTLDNFVGVWKSIVNSGQELNISLKNTAFYFLASLLLTHPFSLIISYFISKKIKGYKFFQIAFYLPCIISSVVLTSVFKNIIVPGGPLYILLSKIGISLPVEGLLGKASTATATIIVYTVFTSFGGNMLIYSSSMSKIPTEIYEAAKLDGCGPFNELIKITIPLIWPTISTQIVLVMTSIFTASGPILLLVDGQHQTSTISYWIYNSVQGGNTGYNLVAAAGLCFTLVAVVVITLVRKVMDRFSNVEY